MTQGKYLLEYEGRHPEFWNGKVDKETGRLIGFNFMGLMLMRTRERISATVIS